jgi:hypothetical protein
MMVEAETEIGAVAGDGFNGSRTDDSLIVVYLLVKEVCLEVDVSKLIGTRH